MSNDYEEQPEFDEFNSLIIWVRRSYNYDEIESDGIKTVEALKEANIKETEIKGVIEDDDVEELKKIIERYDKSCLNSLLKLAIPAAMFYTKLKCMEYLFKLYDEMDDPSKTLMKEKLSETVADIPEIRPTYLHRIAESYSAIGLMNILQKYPELVQPMLEQVDLTGSTPLHQAIKRKNVDIAKCLIRCGADYKKQNKREETPIYLAVLNGQIDILEEIFLLCLSKGTPKKDIFEHTYAYGEGHTVFFPALQSGNNELFKYLIKEEYAAEMLKAELQHRESWKILRSVCTTGMKQALEVLVKIDDNLLARVGEDGTTPLMWAARENQLDVVKLISSSQSGRETINLYDKKGRNVIHYAVKYLRVLEYIFLSYHQLDNEIKIINKLDDSGLTPLQRCAIEGFHESAIVLLDHGCHQIFRGNLDYDHNFFECVEKMNLEVLRSILSFLEEKDKDALLFSLARENAKYEPPLSAAAKNGRDDLVGLFLDKGADGEQKSSRGDQTALHFAVDGKSLSTVEILLRRVPKIVNWRTSYNKSAVRLAVHQGHHEIIKCLLAKGVACPGEKCLLLREALGFCDYSMTGNQDETVLELISSFAMDGSGTSLKSVKFLTRNTITLPLTHLQSHIIPSEYKADVW